MTKCNSLNTKIQQCKIEPKKTIIQIQSPKLRKKDGSRLITVNKQLICLAPKSTNETRAFMVHYSPESHTGGGGQLYAAMFPSCCFTFFFLSPPSSKCLQRLIGSCLRNLHSVHSIFNTIFFVVFAFTRTSNLFYLVKKRTKSSRSPTFHNAISRYRT